MLTVMAFKVVPVAPERVTPLGQIQRTVSTNVKVLMAIRDLSQQDIADVISRSDSAVGHKLSGRARWTLEEVEALAAYSGWPITRFLSDPEGDGAPAPGLEPGTLCFPAAERHLRLVPAA